MIDIDEMHVLAEGKKGQEAIPPVKMTMPSVGIKYIIGVSKAPAPKDIKSRAYDQTKIDEQRTESEDGPRASR